MWSLARTPMLLVPLLLFACKEAQVGPGSCPMGATQLDGVCRKTCANDNDCLLSEFCDPAPDVCLPEPVTGMPKVKVFSVAPVPVAMGGSVEVDFAVVSADRLQLTVEWNDGSVMPLLDSRNEYFGTKQIPNVQQSGTVHLIATKNGVDVPLQRDIELDDGQPRLVDFSVDQARVPAGTSVRVSWEVANADAPIQIAVESGAVLKADAEPKGEFDFVVLAATAFTLTSGQLFARQQVDVLSPQPAEFNAFEVLGTTPSLYDHPVTLVWQTSNAIEVGLDIDGVATGFTTRSPAEVDHGALVLILSPGKHTLRMNATGGGQEKVVSDERMVVFASNEAPSLVNFEYPKFLGEQMGDLRMSWTFLAPDPDLTTATIDFDDRQTPMTVDLDTQITRATPPQTLTATLRAESIAGVSETVATMFSLRPEQEPNEEFLTAQDTFGFAIEGAVGVGDLDFYRIPVLQLDQEALVTLDGPCSTGITLVITDENFGMRSDTAQFDGDCPSISYTAQFAEQLYVDVESIDLSAGVLVPYRMSAEIIDPACGDGSTQSQEQCDDSNRLNGDGCSSECFDEDYLFYAVTNDVAIDLEERPADARLLETHPYPTTTTRPGDGFAMIPLPGGFPFYERTYYGLVIHSNGFVSFLPDLLHSSFDPITPLGASAPNAVVSAIGGDLRRGGEPGDGIYTWTTDTNAIAVEFQGAILIGYPASRLTARIVLHPDGRIILGYPELSGLGDSGSFVAGVQDRKGDRIYALPGPQLEGIGFELRTLGIR